MFTALRKKASVPGPQSKRRDVIIEAASGSRGKTKQSLLRPSKVSF